MIFLVYTAKHTTPRQVDWESATAAMAEASKIDIAKALVFEGSHVFLDEMEENERVLFPPFVRDTSES